jgi:hypothetical protein
VVGGASADDGGRIASVSVSAAGAVAAAHSSYLLALVGCTARGGLAFWSGGDDRVIRRWAAHPDTPLGPPAQTIQALSAVLCLSVAERRPDLWWRGWRGKGLEQRSGTGRRCRCAGKL